MSEIVTVPHPVLRKIAKPIEVVDKRLLDIISDMSKTLLAAKDPEGVGLAAPQVGLPLRMFLIRPEVGNPIGIFINPEIINYSQRQQTPESKKGVYEGCLSIPYHYSPLKRSMSVTVKYQTLDPKSPKPELVSKNEVFSGFPAHIIQHEMDHLNGILFIDHVLSQNSKLYLIKGKAWQEIVI